RPGNYELPLGVPLRGLLFEHAGGMLPGRRFKCVLPGGGSSACLVEEHLDTPMDCESLAAQGTMLGSAAVIVLDDSACIVRAAVALTRFYANESCGQCTPCREGTNWLYRVLSRIEAGQGRMEDLELLETAGRNMIGTTICPLSDASVQFVLSSLKYFREEYEAHVRAGACALEVLSA